MAAACHTATCHRHILHDPTQSILSHAAAAMAGPPSKRKIGGLDVSFMGLGLMGERVPLRRGLVC